MHMCMYGFYYKHLQGITNIKFYGKRIHGMYFFNFKIIFGKHYINSTFGVPTCIVISLI